ncbi:MULTISPECIES: helix-turn-helix domain-containing protein [unclassified Asaia]|uniref:helix-turn-helix domain-containing protein n=1 Tax=unclassified Asaia TaxID=2685023 RepID=UPI0013150588|nr:helix-turn-helix domain-containing protein [Asaia sp. W19]
MTPQAKLVLDHLQHHGSISAVEAAAVYRIRHLPRRILDLKEAGHGIRKEPRKDPTGQRYVRYYLEKPSDSDRA